MSPRHSEPCLSRGPLPPDVYAPRDLNYFRDDEELDLSGFSDLMSTLGAQQGLCAPRPCPRVSTLALAWLCHYGSTPQLNRAAESMLWAPRFCTRTCALPEALHTKEMIFSPFLKEDKQDNMLTAGSSGKCKKHLEPITLDL